MTQLRRSFVARTEAHEIAADQLSLAANALIAGRALECEQHLAAADIRSLGEMAAKICGPIDFSIHRQFRNPVLSPGLRPPGARMPAAAVQRAVYLRDGYRCRFCDCRVVVPTARKLLMRFWLATPLAEKRERSRHDGLGTLSASVDHLLPHSRGGSHEASNLVTACGPCQFGRNRWTLEEVEIADPRSFAPLVDEWDGLSRLGGLRTPIDARPIAAAES